MQQQIYNFGLVMADLSNLSLQDFERAGAQYFPDVYTLPWAADQIRDAAIKLANKPATHHIHDPKTEARQKARAAAESNLSPVVNAPGTPWVHNDACGRVSDCILNTPDGSIGFVHEPICERCQQCLDDTCQLPDADTKTGWDAEDLPAGEPRDIEPDEDSPWTTTGIVFNEKHERIGTVEV